MSGIQLVSWNAGRLKSLPFSFSWLMNGKLKKSDLVLFQNTRVANEDFTKSPMVRADFYRSFWATSSVSEQFGGVATYGRKAVQVALDLDTQPRKYYHCSHNYQSVCPLPNHPIYGISGRTMITDHEKFVLINLYFPPHFKQGHKQLARNRLQKEIYDFSKRLLDSNRNVVLAGDFNFPPEEKDIAISSDSDNSHFENDRKWLKEMKQLGFQDCFRLKHPNSSFYSTNSKFVLPNIKETDMRTSLILANREFVDKHVQDCFYLNFRSLRYPDPSSRIPIKQEIPKESKKYGKNQRDRKPQPKIENTMRIMKPNHYPIVLVTDIEPLHSPIPPSGYPPLQDKE